MQRKTLDTIILFFVIVVISHSSIIADSNYAMLLFNAILVVLTKKDRLVTPTIGILIGCTIVINILTMVIFSTNMELLRIVNFILSPALFSYLLLMYFGVSFWNKLENIAYKLTCLSLILFPLNVLFPSLFSSLFDVFKYITSDMYDGYHYWTSLVYVHCIDITQSTILFARNSGFMWEPGAFAYVLILMISINLIRNGANLASKRIIVYIIALITTFSTSGYFALFAILIFTLIGKGRSVFAYIFLLLFVVVAISLYHNTYFLGEKIDGYLISYDRDYTDFTTDGFNAPKLDRLLFFKYQFEEIFKYPFGYGVYRPIDIKSMWSFVGVNGLSDLFFIHGIPMATFILVFIFKFFKLLNKNRFSIMLVGIFVAVLIMTFSNPFGRSPLIYLMFLTPLIISNKAFKVYEHICNLHLFVPTRTSSNK